MEVKNCDQFATEIYKENMLSRYMTEGMRRMEGNFYPPCFYEVDLNYNEYAFADM